MKLLLKLLPLLLPYVLHAQDGVTNNRAQIAAWLREGAWDNVTEAAKAAGPADTFLLQSAGYAAYQAGDKYAAAGFFDQVLSLDSGNRQALYYSALILKGDEQCAEAIPLLQRLCRIAPATSQYHVLLADCYTAREERTAAVRHLQAARRLAPGSAAIANKLAGAWIRLKTWDSAGAVLAAAMKSNPGDPALFATAITLAYQQKQFARASAFADSLVATRKLRYESLLTALYADIARPDYRHAVELGNILLATGAETEEVFYYTAIAHQHLGNWRTADTLLRRCVARVLKPNLEAYYLALADGAARQGAWTRCKAYYDTAYYLFKNPQTLYRKGLTLQGAGRKGEAEQAYKRYLSLPVALQDTAVSHYLQRVVSGEAAGVRP